MKTKSLISFIVLLLVQNVYSQKINLRYNFYSHEKEAEIVIDSEELNNLTASISFNDETIETNPLDKNNLNFIKINIEKIDFGLHSIKCEIYANGSLLKTKKLTLQKLRAKTNEVKLDLVSGSFIVENKPFIPFGFYCYSPLQSSLAEQEITNGFNTISPYQKINKDTFYERKKYMDRCASLGMKVHYNLLSVAGGGGVASYKNSLSTEERHQLLVDEIELIKDHPALLAWYISDEPIGQGTSVETVERIYNTIKTIDPYHPVSVVFMHPEGAKRYEKGMDIVMTDPYPVPGDIKVVAKSIKRLSSEFYLEKPVWLVPQAFGGGEDWKREPTAGEIRSMTYMGILEGARGIQYFIKHGHNGFPKSRIVWNECAKMAHEIAEITPFLTSIEKPIDSRSHTRATICKSYRYKNEEIIVITNTENRPKPIEIETLYENTTVSEIFENRKIQLDNGFINDYISAYGTHVYKVVFNNAEAHQISKSNISINPSFEDNYNIGVPSGCYANIGIDSGSTFFTDTRTSLHGSHSLRINTPSDGGGTKLSFYPINIIKSSTYEVSVWAKAAEATVRESEFTLSFGKIKSKKFKLTNKWKKFSFNVFTSSEGDEKKSIGAGLSLNTKGTVWFDLLQICQLPVIEFTHTKSGAIVKVSGDKPGDVIRVTLNGRTPTNRSKKYRRPIKLKHSKQVAAGIFRNKKLIAKTFKNVPVHSAIGTDVNYTNKYSYKYTAAGKDALVDGKQATLSFKDKNWQGFEKDDIEVTIDLGKQKKISKVDLNFLNNRDAGIYFPQNIKISHSKNGKTFRTVGLIKNTKAPLNTTATSKTFTIKAKDIKTRYIKITAKNIAIIPKGYKYAGTEAWLFIDEVMVY